MVTFVFVLLFVVDMMIFLDFKGKERLIYGFIISLAVVLLFGLTVYASETSPEEPTERLPLLLGTDVSGNNTYINVDVTTSGNNTALEELAQSVSSNNTNTMLMSADIADINSNLALMVSANAPQFYAYQLTDYYKNYFTGLLKNLPRCNYLAFALPKTHYSGSYSYSVTHYYLIYYIKRDVQSGNPVLGSYPCFDCYTDNGTYHQDEYYYNLSSLPQSGYGSFEDYSALIDYSFDWRGFVATVSAVLILAIFLRRK